MVLLAEVSVKWINFDYLSLTSFDFCKLEDLKVLKRSPDLLDNVKIGQGQLII